MNTMIIHQLPQASAMIINFTNGSINWKEKIHTPTTWPHIFPCLLANLQQRSLVRSLHKKYQRCEEGWTITFNKCSARLEQNLKTTQFTMQHFKKRLES